MFRVFLYFLGVFLVSVGVFFTVIFLNLFTIGYSFLDFVKFISRKIEVWFIVLGFLCIAISLERWIKNELLLRYNFKLERK